MRKQISDRDLQKTVNQRLSRAGTSSSTRVIATVRNGEVVLSGTLNYEIQRRSLVKIITSVAGVRRVVDQLTVQAKKRVI